MLHTLDETGSVLQKLMPQIISLEGTIRDNLVFLLGFGGFFHKALLLKEKSLTR